MRVLTVNESIQWDEIVKSFNEYDVYYLSGYAKAFKIHGDGEPILFYYEDKNCRGINVVMKRDIAYSKNLNGKIPLNKFFDFSTPYGYGGWLIEGKDTKELFKTYNEWCFNNNIISEFVRFHPVLKNHVFSELSYEVIPLGETVSIDTSDKETIWANFTPKNRNVIRKAINNGVTIKNGLSKELFERFISIYNSTMDKDHADEYYYFNYEFYNSIFNELYENSTIFYAEYKGEIIAASIIIYANNKINYHLSGSLRDYQNLAPSNLLLWKVAEWGAENGYKTFHLGGGVGSQEDSLFKFKKAFNRGELNRYHIGKKIYNLEIYNYLVNIVNINDGIKYFPEYRR